MPDSPDGPSALAAEAAFLAGHAVDPARHGMVIDETAGRPVLYCFDVAQPIVTGRPASQLGQGGRVYAVTFTGAGKVVVTNNLWRAGEVPAELRDRFPANGLLQAYPHGDRYDVTYASGSHNLRRVTESSAEAAFAAASRMSAAGDQVDVTHVRASTERHLVASFAGGRALRPGAARLRAHLGAQPDFPVPVGAALSSRQLQAIAAGDPGLLSRIGRVAAARTAQAGTGPARPRVR